MRDTQLYQQILGLSEPWAVSSVELDRSAGSVLVKVDQRPDAVLSCPICGSPAPGYEGNGVRFISYTRPGAALIAAGLPIAQAWRPGLRR